MHFCIYTSKLPKVHEIHCQVLRSQGDFNSLLFYTVQRVSGGFYVRYIARGNSFSLVFFLWHLTKFFHPGKCIGFLENSIQNITGATADRIFLCDLSPRVDNQPECCETPTSKANRSTSRKTTMFACLDYLSQIKGATIFVIASQHR
jgi:hypothetical protein